MIMAQFLLKSHLVMSILLSMSSTHWLTLPSSTSFNATMLWQMSTPILLMFPCFDQSSTLGPIWAADSLLTPMYLGTSQIQSIEPVGLKLYSAPDLVLQTISEGYRLPFDSLPPPSFEQNNMSARCDSSFVQVEVERLLKLGCIREVETRPRLVLPLSSVFSK